MKAKKLLLLFPIIISMCFLSGCLHSVQLNERALVQAIGIDLEDEKIKLTFQVFSPATGGSTNIGASSENAKIIESTGKSVSEAIQNATLIQGKQLFIGHMRIIIIGNALAKNDVEQALNYFNSDSDSRQNVSVALAKDKASDIMKAKINQGILPAETLEKILINTKENGLLLDVKLFEFIGTLANRQQSAVLPIIGVEKQDESSAQGEKPSDGEQTEGEQKSKSEDIESVSSIKVSGIGVFANSKLVCELNEQESRGLLWIINEISRTVIITETDKYSLAVVDIYNSSSKIIPQIDGKKIVFKLIVSCEATLSETSIREGKTVTLDDVPVLERECGKVIEAECMQAFDTAIIKNKADIFNFGNIVWHKDADVWKMVKEDWAQNPDDIELTVESFVKVNRVGLEIRTE